MSQNTTGFVSSSAGIGLTPLLIRPQRGFFSPDVPTDTDYDGEPIIAQAVIEETHHDELEITDHPVEMGAMISDHAYKKPAEVIIHCAWSNSPSASSSSIDGSPVSASVEAGGSPDDAAGSVLTGNAPGDVVDLYEQLLELQASRLLFDVYTGKRHYTNMLFKSISLNTNKKTENALWITAVCREVIIVTTQAVTVPINTSAQADPEATTPTQNSGDQQLLNAAGVTLLLPEPDAPLEIQGS